LFAQVVSKIFNLCGYDPPTSQTDGQTDDMRSQDRALHYSASRGKKETDKQTVREAVIVGRRESTTTVDRTIQSLLHAGMPAGQPGGACTPIDGQFVERQTTED